MRPALRSLFPSASNSAFISATICRERCQKARLLSLKSYVVKARPFALSACANFSLIGGQLLPRAGKRGNYQNPLFLFFLNFRKIKT